MTLNILQSINAFYFQRYFDIFTKRNAILMCVGVWIICFILQIPNFFDLMGYTYVFSNILLNWCSISLLCIPLIFCEGSKGKLIFCAPGELPSTCQMMYCAAQGRTRMDIPFVYSSCGYWKECYIGSYT